MQMATGKGWSCGKYSILKRKYIHKYFSLRKILKISTQVFDATNSTVDRRKLIQEIVVNKWGYKLFFVESICDDPQIIEQNIMVRSTTVISLFIS